MSQIIEAITDTVSSPWFYLALFTVAAIDGFFPVVPSESLVITAGVFAATGTPQLGLIIAVAAAGAFIGDRISYAIGRAASNRLAHIGGRRAMALAWARRTLADRGGLLLVVARYIPGGRTAATLTMGATQFPQRLFTGFAAIAAASWACYSAMVGYLGGVAFEHDPLKGLLLGLGMAAGITVLVELTRHLRKRRATALPLRPTKKATVQ